MNLLSAISQQPHDGTISDISMRYQEVLFQVRRTSFVTSHQYFVCLSLLKYYPISSLSRAHCLMHTIMCKLSRAHCTVTCTLSRAHCTVTCTLSHAHYHVHTALSRAHCTVTCTLSRAHYHVLHSPQGTLIISLLVKHDMDFLSKNLEIVNHLRAVWNQPQFQERFKNPDKLQIPTHQWLEPKVRT